VSNSKRAAIVATAGAPFAASMVWLASDDIFRACGGFSMLLPILVFLATVVVIAVIAVVSIFSRELRPVFVWAFLGLVAACLVGAAAFAVIPGPPEDDTTINCGS
jgi:hypothetical protein